MTTPAPTPTPGWVPPPELPGWFVRAAANPDQLQHTVTEVTFWLLVAFVAARAVKAVVTGFWPIHISPGTSRKVTKAFGVALVVALVVAIGYLLWILAVISRSM